MKRTFALALAVIAAGVLPALAQEAVAVVAVEPTIWSQIRDPLYTLLVGLLPVVIGIIGVYLRKYLGDKAAAIAQAMLQAAAERAAAQALNQGGATAARSNIGVAPTASAIDVGVDYLKSTMPDTIKKVGATTDNLRDIISANIGKLKISGAAPPTEIKVVAVPATPATRKAERVATRVAGRNK